MTENVAVAAATNPQTAAPASPAAPAASPAASPAPATADAATQTAASAAQPAAPAPAAAPAPSTPEKYAFILPDNAKLPDAVMTEFSTVAKDAGLSQEAAQKVIGALAPKIAAENAAAFQSYTQGLVAQAKADKEFGGDALDANLAIAKKAIDTFGTPALRTLLDQSGLGNHPEVIRAFLKAGKALSPDTFVPGGVRPPKGDNNAANKLYPKT